MEISMGKDIEWQQRIDSVSEDREIQDTPCAWKQVDDDWGTWESSCGQLFCLDDGTPWQNNMRYCPFCGNSITEGD